ncbi:DUF1804 family protein [Paucibacter sp. O1-1]|nr:DUF1804 family protein [Paucibacter sp. O1-1]MDA3826593.1 DUF1804 family protein [Paucibacter sp. O1-1]
MAYDQSTRNKVRAKYVQGQPLASAATAHKVPYNTARNWKRQATDAGDDWDIARNAKRMTQGSMADMTGQILLDLAEQFEATIKAMREAKDLQPMDKTDMLLKLSDGYVKTMAAAGRGNPKLNRLSVAMDVLKELDGYIADKHPKMRMQFLDVAEGFGPVLAARFSA